MHFIKSLYCIVGGETIKSISQQSGARIELQRNPPPNADPNMKMFTIRGTPQQIDYARQLIEEKIGVSGQLLFCLLVQLNRAESKSPLWRLLFPFSSQINLSR